MVSLTRLDESNSEDTLTVKTVSSDRPRCEIDFTFLWKAVWKLLIRENIQEDIKTAQRTMF